MFKNLLPPNDMVRRIIDQHQQFERIVGPIRNMLAQHDFFAPGHALTEQFPDSFLKALRDTTSAFLAPNPTLDMLNKWRMESETYLKIAGLDRWHTHAHAPGLDRSTVLGSSIDGYLHQIEQMQSMVLNPLEKLRRQLLEKLEAMQIDDLTVGDDVDDFASVSTLVDDLWPDVEKLPFISIEQMQHVVQTIVARTLQFMDSLGFTRRRRQKIVDGVIIGLITLAIAKAFERVFASHPLPPATTAPATVIREIRASFTINMGVDQAFIKPYSIVSRDGLRIHIRPGSRSQCLGKVRLGQIVCRIEKSKHWVHIEWNDFDQERMRQGWVRSKYLKPLSQPVSKPRRLSVHQR